MTADDFTYKPQDVNYLGFLEAQLRDLTGIATLAYELMQNADDVQDDNGRSQTTHLSFDVTDEALIVENNGVFRSLDFERLQNIASGGKREEMGTIGAFGIGFVAVYQITDAPEIFSNGLHWTIRPGAPPNQRIEERKVETSGTRLRLPWAFDVRSPIRRTLRMEAIRPDQLDDFAATIATAIETAALFLQQLQVLEVKRNGRLLQRIERTMPAKERLMLQDRMGRTTTWMLMHGEFAAEAGELRSQYPWQIEPKRRSTIHLAVPVTGLDRQGRLFAVLPTASTTPLPFHINADFYPTTDRKRIHFDSGYQAEWNRAAISCAANTLARQVKQLPEQLGPAGFWHLLQKMAYTQQLADEGELPPVFATFWQAVSPLLPVIPVMFSANNEWRLPADVRLWGHVRGETAVSLLNALHIPIVHPDLASYDELMRRPEIGAPDLSIQDVIDALGQVGLVQPGPLFRAPSFLRDLDALHLLWQLIDDQLTSLDRPQTHQAAITALNQFALVLTEGMTLERLNRVYRGKPEAKVLFPDVAWLHDMVPPDRFPGRFVRNFGVRQAVELLAETPVDQLEDAWRMGRLDVPGLFRWFESQQIEIFADDPVLQREIRRLPLVPVEGELRPLSDLYLPGGFEDPLKLANLVDLDAMGGRPQFLRDLGVQALDFETYVHAQLPRALAQYPDLPSDAHHRLVQLLAGRMGEFRDDQLLQAQLNQLPLIACMDGSFRTAQVVYASREVQKLLGTQVHIAEPVQSKSVRALYRWLGVRDQPAAADIVQSLLTLSKTWGRTGMPLDAATRTVVRQCLLRLNTLLKEEKIPAAALDPLREHKTVPNRYQHLTRPDHLFLADSPDFVDQFVGLNAYLLSLDEGVGEITAVLGIQPLSQAVTLQVIDALDAVEDLPIQERIANRLALIDRILRAESISGDDVLNTAFLQNMRVFKLPHLQIQTLLTVRDKVLRTEPQTVPAAFIAESHVLFLADGPQGISWATVARELAALIKGSSAVGGLAIGIKEVLAAESFAAAAQILDELGYA